MGADSGLFALDFDFYKGRDVQEYYDDLKDQGLLPATRQHSTKNGGVHLIYSNELDWPNCNPYPGVEVKGEGGYIIVPPSEGYTVVNEDVAEAPQKLIEYLKTRSAKVSQSTDQLFRSNILNATDFHESLTVLAARMAVRGEDDVSINASLMTLLNSSNAANPQHSRHARWKKIIEGTDEELKRIVSSAYSKYNPAATSELLGDLPADVVAKMKTTAERVFGMAKLNINKEPSDTTVDKLITNYKPDEWPFADEGYFASDDIGLENSKYVIHPIFAENETVLVSANPKAGKTAIVIKLAFNLACGFDLGKTFTVPSSRPVLYFGLEGRNAIKMRIAAEKKRCSQEGITLPDDIPLFIVERSRNLANDEVKKRTVAQILQADRYYRDKAGHGLGMIVIDTLTKAMPGKNQNDVDDTSALFEIVDMMRDGGVSANVVFVHHLNKGGTVRGSSNITAEVDVVARVERDEATDTRMFKIDDARSIEDNLAYMFTFTSVDLGKNAQGYMQSAPVVSLTEHSAVVSANTDLKGSMEFNALCKVAIEMGSEMITTRALLDKLNSAAISRSRLKKYGIGHINKLLKGKEHFAFNNHIIDVIREKDAVLCLKVRKVSA